MSTVEEILATPTSTQDKPDEALSDAERIKSGQVYGLAGGEWRWISASEKAEALASAFRELDEKCEGVIEAFPKVVQCFGCDEYAFDGCFTAYQTDEGSQGFCPECVTAIEQRSKQPSYRFDMSFDGMLLPPVGVTYGDNDTINISGTGLNGTTWTMRKSLLN